MLRRWEHKGKNKQTTKAKENAGDQAVISFSSASAPVSRRMDNAIH